MSCSYSVSSVTTCFFIFYSFLILCPFIVLKFTLPILKGTHTEVYNVISMIIYIVLHLMLIAIECTILGQNVRLDYTLIDKRKDNLLIDLLFITTCLYIITFWKKTHQTNNWLAMILTSYVQWNAKMGLLDVDVVIEKMRDLWRHFSLIIFPFIWQ
jgi:hypothetical protein